MAKKNKDPFSLYLRNGVYYARVWDEAQRCYTVVRSTKATDRDSARDIANEMIKNGQLVKKSGDPIFSDEILKFWETRPGVDPRYCREMASKVRTHIKPSRHFKGVRMSTVNQFHVNRLLDDMKQAGASPFVLNSIKRMIIKFLNHALSLGYIPKDFTKQITKFDKVKTRRGFLEPAEIAKIEALPWPDTRVKAAILCGAIAGMRKGEIRGLRWRNIDFEKNTIDIVENYVGHRGEDGGFLFKKPKRNSARKFPYLLVSPALKETLLQLHSETPFNKPDDLCFVSCGRKYNPYGPIHEDVLREGLIKILEAINIPADEQRRLGLVFHSLRHSHVTFFAAITDQTTSMAIAGHDSASAHAIYKHSMQSQIETAFSSAKAFLDQFRTGPEGGGIH